MFEKETQQILDLIDNKDFINWLILPDEQSDRYWRNIMKTDDNKRKHIQLLQKLIAKVNVDEKEFSGDEKMRIWKGIARRSVRRRRYYLYRWRFAATFAAAFLLLLVVSAYMYRRFTDNRHIDYHTLMNEPDDGGQDNIRLILSDEQVVTIKDDGAELIYDKEGNINIFDETIRQAVPKNLSKTNKTLSNIPLNNVIVPYGKRVSVILGDGTKIWLNSGSHLIYPAVFEGKTREIFVEGEIFLEVTANREKLFVVKTNELVTEVLGTNFNVNAYKDEKNHSVVLVTGSVAVKNKTGKASAALKPNQMYDYDVGNKQYRIRDVDIYDHICWKYGFFHFTNEDLPTIFERLHKYYNIDIEYERQHMAGITVSGKLDLKDSLENVLNSVALTGDFRYEMRDSIIVITKND